MKRGRTYTQRARAERTEATRRRIVDAALQRFTEDWYDEVTLASVAAQAGVSQQTLVNHFGSKEGLVEAVAAQAEPEYRGLRDRVAPGDVEGLVGALMEQYEASGDANARWAALEERTPAIAPLLARARAFHRESVAATLGVTDEQRKTLLAVATDVLTWKMLRRDHGLSADETAAALRDLVEALR
ncbi:MAG TPA: helix-turn-helix domain-containing protein [Capillimicrobium sp.]|jgi:AcrR family transcriptional regulator